MTAKKFSLPWSIKIFDTTCEDDQCEYCSNNSDNSLDLGSDDEKMKPIKIILARLKETATSKSFGTKA